MKTSLWERNTPQQNGTTDDGEVKIKAFVKQEFDL